MNPLIEVAELAKLSNTDVVILDARFRLQDPAMAEKLFLEAHIPNAQRVDLEKDLSGAKTGTNGRHPLPQKQDLQALLGRLGIRANTLVVLYDDTDHAGAARAWMLLRWLGHEKVKVLHGGLKAWKAAGLAVETGPSKPRALKEFPPRPSLIEIYTHDQLAGKLLIDARAPERYRGDIEPIDPKAGHIPGAKNLPYSSLLDSEGKFLPLPLLKERLAAVATPFPTFYCGSGVTACVLLLAAALTNQPASLYAGSWSEWCTLPQTNE